MLNFVISFDNQLSIGILAFLNSLIVVLILMFITMILMISNTIRSIVDFILSRILILIGSHWTGTDNSTICLDFLSII